MNSIKKVGLDQETSPDIDPTAPARGRWYWVKSKEGPWLGCVTHVGSNFAEVESVSGGDVRIHLDEFKDECDLEPNPEGVIDKEIAGHQKEAAKLMGRVQELTERLSITMGPAQLEPKNETSALALRGSGESLDTYKKALVKAKEKTLPELFKQIEEENRSMGQWMKAKLIPLKAQVGAMKPVIKAIEQRIFNVELYAGLIEEVTQITEGKPAPMNEKVHLFQRRCYMDEECLAQYEAGGMEFKNIKEFDQWLARPNNLNRLLPKPRCIVAFQVRRDTKEREFESFFEFINFALSGYEETDKYTFLYMRNGEQLFRLSTGIEFGQQLFPDLEHSRLDGTGKLWAYSWGGGGRIEKLITDAEYQDIVAEEEAQAAEVAKLPPKDRFWKENHNPQSGHYSEFTSENIYYDEISKFIQDQIDEHNRLVLVLQGILDRSPVMHPHPQWKLWTPEGFESALTLVYDDSRTLTPGDAPDFEAYRTRLNVSLQRGSVTVGQEVAWEMVEAARENERRNRSWRNRDRSELRKYRPYGNPGPGLLAKVSRFSKTKGCGYDWERERQGYRRSSWRDTPEGPIQCHLNVETTHLLNVDAYTPGDFHKFFDDPRTRALYLKWAPLLLVAEDYHAGKRKVGKASSEE